jgi:hypothetical protein
MTSSSQGSSWCRIDSFDALEREQPAILERIARLPQGGNLFLTHPFLLLEEVGVELSEDFKRQLLAQEPALATCSPLAYRALRANSGVAQAVRVQLEGLFRREGHAGDAGRGTP